MSLQTAPSLDEGSGTPGVHLKNVEAMVHTHIFAEGLPCAHEPSVVVAFAPEAVSSQIGASSWCWGAPHSPPGPWQC